MAGGKATQSGGKATQPAQVESAGSVVATTLLGFCLVQLAVYRIVSTFPSELSKIRSSDLVPQAGASLTPFMHHPATAPLSAVFLGAVLLLGRHLSTGGVLYEPITSRWRGVHASRLDSQSLAVVHIQRIRSPLLDAFFRCPGFFAEEDFYMIIAPLIWWIAPRLLPFGFNLILVALGGLVVGDSLKDLLHIPRPSHPQLWRYSHSASTSHEYGMPSTHAMNAVSNSLIFLMCSGGECGAEVGYGSLGMSEQATAYMATAWIVSICASRLYLGVHTLDDVAMGSGLGLMVARVWLAYHTALEHALDHGGPLFPLGVVCFIICCLLVTRSSPPVWTPSKRQGANVCGLLCGMLCVTWAAGRKLPAEKFPIVTYVSGTKWNEEAPAGGSALETAAWAVPLLGRALGRLSVGLCVAFGGEMVIKQSLSALLSWLLAEPRGYQSDRVYVPVKFLAQCWMAAAIAYLGPRAMMLCGLW